MRPLIPYFTSVVVHATAAAVMSYCVPMPMRWEVVVAKGKPIVTVFVAPTVSSEPPPVPIEAEVKIQPQPTRPPTHAEEVAAQPVTVAKQPVEVALNDSKPEKAEAEPEKAPTELENMPPRKAPSQEEIVTDDGELPKVVEKTKVEKAELKPTPTEIPDTVTSAEKRDDIAAQAVTLAKKPLDEKPLEKKTHPPNTPDDAKPTVDDSPPRRTPLPDEIVVVDAKPTKTLTKQTETKKDFQIQQSAAMPYQASSQLGAEIELPRKLPQNAPPSYPQDALLAGIQGRVVLLVVVTSEGLVQKANVDTTSGYRSLDDAAIAAVRGWRFEPARKRGLPIEYEVLVPINFSIRRG